MLYLTALLFFLQSFWRFWTLGAKWFRSAYLSCYYVFYSGKKIHKKNLQPLKIQTFKKKIST